MRIVIVFITLCCVSVNANICGSLCVCRDASDTEYLGDHVDCSYSKPALFSIQDELPAVVHTLDLSSNNLTDITASFLYRSKSMKELILSNNKISRVESVFQLPELLRLDMSGNLLESIDKDVFLNIKKLEYLNLANNRFTTFNKLTFHHLSNLREIVLDNNNIGPSLREINLFDRSGFGLTHNIKALSISGIGLNSVPDNFFSDAYDLKKVIISNNHLIDIFEIPFTLEYLDLSDNPISEISIEDFAELPALKVLKLNNLAIREVQDYVFEDLHGLQKLELERNRNLTKFSSLCFGREVLEDADDFALEELSVMGSRLSRLEEKLAEPFGRLVRLDLQGNPWVCDCKILWLKKLQIAESDYDHLRCGSPPALRNARIFELEPSYFACSVDRHYTALAIAAVAFCLILAAMAVWFFVVVPRCQSRGTELRNLYVPGAAYTVLPLGSNSTAF